MAYTIQGPMAELRWGYHLAATLGSWTLTGPGHLTAQIVSSDAFRLQQTPLTFRVVRSSTAPWEWPVRSLSVVDGTLIGELGPQKE